jgi:sulfate adenylyltransferase
VSNLILPHGSPELKPRLLTGPALEEERQKAQSLKKVPMTSRETSDLIMMGIGAFTPLDGFMGRDDWQGCCETFSLPSRKSLFWPIPITLSVEESLAGSIAIGEQVALWDIETESVMHH